MLGAQCLPGLPTSLSILLTSCPAFWGLEKLQDVEEMSSGRPTAWGGGLRGHRGARPSKGIPRVGPSCERVNYMC